MVIKVPSLSASGWLGELSERADKLLSYYITSEYSQSYVYKGRVTSLTYHIQQHGNNPDRLENRVTESLYDYFSRYFEGVDVEVSTDIPNEDDPERVNLRIDINVYEQGKAYKLGREIQLEKSTIKQIMEINNG